MALGFLPKRPERAGEGVCVCVKRRGLVIPGDNEVVPVFLLGFGGWHPMGALPSSLADADGGAQGA